MNPPKPSQQSSIELAVFDSEARAAKAIVALQESGIRDDEVTVFQSKEDGQQPFESFEAEAETGVPANHAVAGSLVGGSLGGLSAVATLATVAGLPVLVAGGMAAALAGGVVGGLAGAMMNRGLKKESADYFEQAVADGKIVVAVEPADHSPERLATAARVLADSGAQPIPLNEG